jgi:hypothetical protein
MSTSFAPSVNRMSSLHHDIIDYMTASATTRSSNFFVGTGIDSTTFGPCPPALHTWDRRQFAVQHNQRLSPKLEELAVYPPPAHLVLSIGLQFSSQTHLAKLGETQRFTDILISSRAATPPHEPPIELVDEDSADGRELVQEACSKLRWFFNRFSSDGRSNVTPPSSPPSTRSSMVLPHQVSFLLRLRPSFHPLPPILKLARPTVSSCKMSESSLSLLVSKWVNNSFKMLQDVWSRER